MTTAIRNRLRCLLLGVAAGAVAPALAQEFQPYPAPRITPKQFADYAEEVQQAYGDTVQLVREEKVVVFADMRTRTFWVFTTKDHPAHPAWIVRQMFEEDGQVKVRQIGYFAGSEPEFARLFADYQKRNTQLMEEVQRRNR